MYLDNEVGITAGREIWGFPKKRGEPNLRVEHEALVGTLKYGQDLVSMGTMQYKHINIIEDIETGEAIKNGVDMIMNSLNTKMVNLKLIPSADGEKLDIAELVEYKLSNIKLKGAWEGPARLHLVPHALAPVADFPVIKVLGAKHIKIDATLSLGKVLYNYL
jgi:acetoacetate decarboxylase